MQKLLLTILLVLAQTMVAGEDGSRLWLRFDGGGEAPVEGVKCLASQELRDNWKGAPITLKRQKGLPREGYRIVTERGGYAFWQAATSACSMVPSICFACSRQEPRVKR